jgi:hypothetical protein
MGNGQKNMTDMSEECLDIINNGHFNIVDPGPLHMPIRGFSLRRNDKLALILETEADSKATSTAVEHPPGTVRLSVERAKLINIAGVEAELVGVVPYSIRTAEGDPMNRALKESAQVHSVTVSPGDVATATYTIDWLENLPASPFVWPDTIKTTTNTTKTRSIGMAGGDLTISSDSEQFSLAPTAAKLVISGVTFYVCALGRDRVGGEIKPGCVVYDGTPDDAFRKKVRTALSFALGLYLVDLGHTIYDRDWHIVSALARSAYSLRRHAFDMGPEQLAPLGPRFLNELNSNQLTQAVNALVSSYDELDLANLSWAYWHACAATPHIAPAHFGAAVEALQRAYIRTHPNAVVKVWAPRQVWKTLRAAMASSIEQTDIPDEAKTALARKLANFNQVDQRPLLKAVFAALGLQLGEDEDAAWRRRNKAAHGMPIPEGQELAAIRDMKLLRGLFQRMLLRITNAADQYIDYTSPNHPFRRLEEVPPVAT